MGDVLNETTTAGVVVFARGGGAAVAVCEAVEEEPTELMKARIGEVGEFLQDGVPVVQLAGCGFGVAEEKGVFFVVREKADFGGAGFDAVLTGVDPLGVEFDEGGTGQVFELMEAGIVIKKAPEE